MYLPIPGGTTVEIQGLKCQLPPIGYVVNVLSGELEYRGVYERSEAPLAQYWQRQGLPSWYSEKEKKEIAYERRRKEDDPPFYDKQLDEFIQDQWDKRLNGFWYMNKGVPTFLTGLHWLYLEYWQIDIGFPKFRIPDLEYFYFLQYCIEDPLCLGAVEVTKRRFGKSFRAGIFIYEYISRTQNANGGIQSKTLADAKKFFGKTIIKPFKKMPRFFRPEYDMSGGITPKTELRFEQTNVRGKNAEETLKKEALDSLIDFQSSDELAYDGQKTHRMVCDEAGKTTEASIYERHDVLRYCVMDDEARIIGKILYTTTVEQLKTEREDIQESFKILWEDSDQNDKKENGQTASGLYRFFMPASRARGFDLYGFPDEEKALKLILADRAAKKNNTRSLAAIIRKEPLTIEEAFNVSTKCEFNVQKIIEQEEILRKKPVYLRQCRMVIKEFKPEKLFPTQKVRIEQTISFIDDTKGGWFILENPDQKYKYYKDGYLDPISSHRYQIGVDTTKDMNTIKGSKPRILVLSKSRIVGGEEMGMRPIAMYMDITRLDVHFDDEVLKACMAYSCTVNYEIDARTDYYRHFVSKLALKMLEWTPKIARNPIKPNDRIEPGTRSGNPMQLRAQLEVLKMFIDGTDDEGYNGFVHLIFFPSLLKQLREYDHNDRTKSDEVIALAMALLPIMGEKPKDPQKPSKKIKILSTYKLNAA